MNLTTLWEFETDGPVSGCPAVVDTSGGPILVVGTDQGDIIAIDALGTECWRHNVGGIVSGWPIVAELPQGKTVLVGDSQTRVHAYAPDGTFRWRTDLKHIAASEQFNSGMTPWTGLAAIEDGGSTAFVLTDKGGRLTAFDSDG